MILYKYLTVEKADEWLIGEDSILLTPPKYLNDLLEFRVLREPSDVQERRALYDKFQMESPSALTFEQYNSHVTHAEYMINEPASMREGLSQLMGVISLSSDPINELMWAHYGLNKGVAVGYQSVKCLKRDDMSCAFLPIGAAFEVNYTDILIPIIKDFSNSARVLSTKRSCWSYEGEWRIILPLAVAKPITRNTKTYFAMPANPEKVAHLVFGADAETTFIERVRNWASKATLNLQKVSINHGSHELELSDI